MDAVREIGKVLLVFGALLVLVGAVFVMGAKLPFRLGRLPATSCIRGGMAQSIFQSSPASC